MYKHNSDTARNSIGKKPQFLIVWTSADSNDLKTFVSQYCSVKKHAEDLKRAEVIRVFNSRGELLSFADKRFNIYTTSPKSIAGELETKQYIEMFQKCYEETTGKKTALRNQNKIITGSDGSQYTVKRTWYNSFIQEHPEYKSRKLQDDLLFYAFRALVTSGLAPFEPTPESQSNNHTPEPLWRFFFYLFFKITSDSYAVIRA